MQWFSQVGRLVAGIILGALFFTMDLSSVFSVGIILTIVSAVTTWQILSMSNKIKKIFVQGDRKTNRSEDVTSENRVPPAVLRSAILMLNDLGFRRLGEEALVTLDGEEIGCEWVFVSADRLTSANLVSSRSTAGGFLAAFETIFPHASWLLTLYPSGFPAGETITLPDFRLRHTRQGLQVAYELHQIEKNDFSQQHGKPIEIHTIADYLAFVPVFRERHIEKFLRRAYKIQQFHPYFWAGSTAFFLIATLLSSIAPELAILIIVLGSYIMCFYKSYIDPVHLRVAQLFRLVAALLLLLLPLYFIWNDLLQIHLLLLGTLLLIFQHCRSVETKALDEEIKSGKLEVNW